MHFTVSHSGFAPSPRIQTPRSYQYRLAATGPSPWSLMPTRPTSQAKVAYVHSILSPTPSSLSSLALLYPNDPFSTSTPPPTPPPDPTLIPALTTGSPTLRRAPVSQPSPRARPIRSLFAQEWCGGASGADGAAVELGGAGRGWGEE